ncbi:MAG: hypothetical protein WC797_02430 [Candidatus Paceibacterota bacterium]|jgi:hypothetical protein
MESLLIITTISAVGAASVILRKVYKLRPQTNSGGIFDVGDAFWANCSATLEDRLKKISRETSRFFNKEVRPKIVKFLFITAEKIHALASVAIDKFVYLSLVAQGKRSSRNKGATSLFIRDLPLTSARSRVSLKKR